MAESTKERRRRDRIQKAIDITNEVGKFIDEPTAFAFFKHQIDNFEVDANGNVELAEEYLFRAIKFFHQWSLEMEMPRSRILDEGRLDVEAKNFSWFCCVCWEQFSPCTLVDQRMFHYVGKPHWKMFMQLVEEKGLGGSSRLVNAVNSIRQHDWVQWKSKVATNQVGNESDKEMIKVENKSDKEVMELKRVPNPQQKSSFSHFPQNQLKSILKKPGNSAQYSKVTSSREEFNCRKLNEWTKHKEAFQNKKLATIKPKIQARTVLPAKNVGPMYKGPNPHGPSTNFPYPSGPPRPPLGSYNSTNSIRPKSSFIKNAYTCQFCGFENDPDKPSSFYSPNKNTLTCESCGQEGSKTKYEALNLWENAHVPVGYKRASQGISWGYQNYKKSKAVEENTPAGLLATLFPQGYQGANNTAPANFQRNEGGDKVEEDEEILNPPEEVKVEPKAWEAADDKGFPAGWKWKLSNPWARRLKFMAPGGNVFKSRMAAGKYMEDQGGYTQEQIEKVKNSDDLSDKEKKSEGDKNEFFNENDIEEEMADTSGDISLEQRIEEIHKCITTDLDSDASMSGNKDLDESKRSQQCSQSK